AFYLPGYGLRGVPVYLLADVNAYRQRVYSEPRVGLSADFDDIVADAASGGVAVSPPVADFWRLEPGTQVLLGLDVDRRAVAPKTAGLLPFLPRLPPHRLTHRQGYLP